MSGPDETLFELYRDALRRGHVAALRERHVEAIEAYREAAGLVGDRSAPHVGRGRVELALGRPAEALAAFDMALRRAPTDEGALRGLVEALTALGRPADAAEGYDRLATVQLDSGRRADALTTVERAIELAESRWRRSLLERLRVEQGDVGTTWLHKLPAGETAVAVDPGGPATTGERRTAEEPVRPTGADGGEASVGMEEDIRTAERAPSDGAPDRQIAAHARELASKVDQAAASGDVRTLLDSAIAYARAERPRAALDACEDALSAAPTDPEVHETLAWLLERDGRHVAAREKRTLIGRYLRVLDDPRELDARAFDGESRADIPALLEVAEAHARQGRLVTALDTCYVALGLAPAEPAVHLAIARVRLALGWRRQAIDGSSWLARLLDLTGDDDGRAALAGFVGRELSSPPGPPIRSR